MDKNFSKLLQTSILIASLIMLPFPLAAPAKSTNETAYLKDLQSGISNLGSSILQMQQQYLQQKKNLNDQINRNKYLAQYKPKGEPSKYFPRCIVPPTNLSVPTSLCTNSNSVALAASGITSSIVSNAKTVQDLANEYQEFYAAMERKAQNTKTTYGIQCLEESRDELLNQLQDTINVVDNYIGQINQQNQHLRDQAENYLSTIREANYQLNGGHPTTNTQQNFSLATLLGDACTNTLGISALDNQKGLRGVKGTIEQNFKPNADRILANQSDVAGTSNNGGRLFNKEIKDIKNYLKKYGIKGIGEHVKGRSGIGIIPAATVASIVQRLEGDLTAEKNNVQNTLQEYGVSLPELDSNFSAKSKSITGGPKGNMVEDSIISHCIDGSGEQALGIELNALIASITQRNVKDTAGSTVDDYKRQLYRIWNSNNSYRNKLELTKKLDNSIGKKANITVTYQDVDNHRRQIKELPSKYFEQAVEKCKAQYKQMGNSSDGRSGNAQAQSATKALAELQKNVDNFADLVVSTLRKELLQCSQQTVSLDKCSSSMDPQQGNFCWEQASVCAQQIRHCSSKTNELISAKTTAANQAAHLYNQGIKDLLTKQQNFLQTVRDRIFHNAQYLRQVLPNNNFSIQDKDLFVEIPAMLNGQGDLEGVLLIGGGDTEKTMAGVSKALDKMKAVVTSQKESLRQSLDKYISDVHSAIQEQTQRWSELVNTCQKAVSDYQQQQAAADQARREALAMQQKQLEEELEQLNKVCNKYAKIHDHPNGACESQIGDLMDTISEVSSKIELDPNITDYAREFNQYCNNTQANDDGAEDEKRNVCENYCESDLNTLLKGMRDSLLAMVPRSVETDKVERYLKDKVDLDDDDDDEPTKEKSSHDSFNKGDDFGDKKFVKGVLKDIPDLKSRPLLVKAINKYVDIAKTIKKEFEKANDAYNEQPGFKEATDICGVRELEIEQVRLDDYVTPEPKKDDNGGQNNTGKENTPTTGDNTTTSPSPDNSPAAGGANPAPSTQGSPASSGRTSSQTGNTLNESFGNQNRQPQGGVFPSDTNQDGEKDNVWNPKAEWQRPTSYHLPTLPFLQQMARWAARVLDPAAIAKEKDDDKDKDKDRDSYRRFNERAEKLREDFTGKYSKKICSAYKQIDALINSAQNEADILITNERYLRINCQEQANDYKALQEAKISSGGVNNALAR